MLSRNNTIIQRVRDYAIKHGMLKEGDRLLLSLSAGKDSIALLDIMEQVATAVEITLGVFHLNHLTRGMESDKDQIFISDIAAKKDLKLYVERYDFGRLPARVSFEDFARRKRYCLLEEIARRDSWTKIATAHTLNDNSETVLMRILRGTGIYGLRGITGIRGNLIRPLLCLKSEEVYAYLEERGLEWREDASNIDSLYLRNFVRNELVPLASSRFPGAVEALDRLSLLAEENSSLVDHLIKKTYGRLFDVKDGVAIIHPEKLENDDRMITCAMLAAIREHFGEYVSSSIIDEALRAYRSNRPEITVRAGRKIDISFERGDRGPIIKIFISSRENRPPAFWQYRVDVPADSVAMVGVTIKECAFKLLIKREDYSRFLAEGRGGEGLFLALNDDVEYIVLRSRSIGDRIRLRSGGKKIKDLFIDMKIPTALRGGIPVVMAGEEIAAVMTGLLPGRSHRVGSNFMVSEGSQKILAIYRVEG